MEIKVKEVNERETPALLPAFEEVAGSRIELETSGL